MKRLFCKPLRIVQLSLVNRLHLRPSFLTQRAFSQTREKYSNPKIICSGCGAGLQTRDIAAAGYIPTHKKLLELQKRSEEAIKEASSSSNSSSSSSSSSFLASTLTSHGCVCQRCFEAKNYGRLIPLSMPTETYRAYLDYLMNLPADKGSLLILVLDVWDFHGSALSIALRSILNRRPPRPSMLVVINKADLLPSTVKQERVLSWARKELRKAAISEMPKYSNTTNQTSFRSNNTNLNCSWCLSRYPFFGNDIKSVKCLDLKHLGPFRFFEECHSCV